MNTTTQSSVASVASIASVASPTCPLDTDDYKSLILYDNGADVHGDVYYKGQLVCKTFPVIPNCVGAQAALIPSSSVLLVPAYEGTCIRLYHVPELDEWIVSTFHKINAFTSFWGDTISFGERFEQGLWSEFKTNPDFARELKRNGGYITRNNILSMFTSILSPDVVYTFLIKTTMDNRIVAKYGRYPQLVYTGEFDRMGTYGGGSGSRLDDFFETNKTCVVARDDLAAYINDLDPFVYQGVFLVDPATRLSFYKIYSFSYAYWMELRGNEPNLVARYCALRTTPQLSSFLYLYSKHLDTFNAFERTFNELVDNLYEEYVRIFVRKQDIQIPSDEYGLCKRLYIQHQERFRKAKDIQEEPEMKALSMVSLQTLRAELDQSPRLYEWITRRMRKDPAGLRPLSN